MIKKLKRGIIRIWHNIKGCPDKYMTESNAKIRVCRRCMKIRFENKEAEALFNRSMNY